MKVVFSHEEAMRILATKASGLVGKPGVTYTAKCGLLVTTKISTRECKIESVTIELEEEPKKS